MVLRTRVEEFKGISYEIKFPNTGQFIDIRLLETSLSKGSAMTLLKTGIPDDIEAYCYITTYAHLKIMVPTLFEKLTVKSIWDLEREDFEELRQFYFNKIKPWLDEVKEELRLKFNPPTNESK